MQRKQLREYGNAQVTSYLLLHCVSGDTNDQLKISEHTLF